ncbi:MAG: BamA/TamA family outer membrane protein [Deltaproteobacteria bacterium]|nr:BamA/TamA family outer membrane protein [Nannocystaceae bacterium]
MRAPVDPDARTDDGAPVQPVIDPPEPSNTPAPSPPPKVRDIDAGGPAPGDVDLADPMAPVVAALASLRKGGIAVGTIERTSNVLQGDLLTTTISGTEHPFLQFVLEGAAAEGYLVLLRPSGRDRYELVALRARPGQERGLSFIGVERLVVDGEFRDDENGATIDKLVDTSDGLLIPLEVQDTLRPAGYRATMRPLDDGVLELEVQPGRAIRRVRVHGHTPLYERELRRVLSVEARPGALAPGACVSRKRLRTKQQRSNVAPICEPDDRVCQAWEKAERARVERYLFDAGYLRGTVRFALACDPHDPDNVDLHMVLHKGSGYRVPSVAVTGNLGLKDQKWVRRSFKPKYSPIIPIPKRVTRKHVDEAKERIEREYAAPRSGTSGRSRRALALPYPGVRVETNYDRLRREEAPITPKFPLVVDVQLGVGVDTDFLEEKRVSENRLRAQLQIFERREAANASTARREAANLRGYYQSRGFMLATVDGQFQDFGGLHKLTFAIAEGARVRIREVELERPRGVPRGVLAEVERELVRAHELKSGGRFTDAGARKDLGVLLAAYAKKGYLCARAQVRVSFWKDGHSTPGTHAKLDLGTELDDAGSPSWLTAREAGGSGFTPAGLAAIRKQRNVGAWVVIDVDPGPRVVTSSSERVRHLEVQIPASREVDSLPQTTGAWGAPRMLRDGPLRRRRSEAVGLVPLSLTLDRDVERNVVERYQRSGYPLADAEMRWVYTAADGRQLRAATAERLTDADIGMCEEHARDASVAVATELSVYEGRRATFGTTLVRGNFKTRYQRRNGKPAAIAREIQWKEGDPYSRDKVESTRAGIDGMGVTEGVQIRQQERNCKLDSDPSRPCVVHQLVTITESKDRGMDLEWGFGGATLDPLYVFVRPSFPNMWGTAWDLSLDAHFGANLEAFSRAFCVGEACYERSGRVTLSRQRIGGSPLTFDIGAQVQRRATPARGVIDSVLGHVRLTWPIDEHWQVYAGYLIQAANISKDVVKPALGGDTGCGASGLGSCRPPNRGEAIVPDRTAALQTGARWERVDNAFNPDDGMVATADAMLASPCLGGQDWWMRFDFGWEHFIPIRRTNKRLNFRYALSYGHAVAIPLPRNCAGGDARTQSVPEVWRYFGGGTRDLGLRGILPQTMLVDVEEIQGPYGVTTLRPTAQGGHIRALGTVALQVVSARNFLGGKLAHSIFVDFGVLTQRWRQVVWNRDFRRAVGINFIKWDIKIVTVSLGYAVLVPNWIWKGNVRPTDDKNGRFVFDVGATF